MTDVASATALPVRRRGPFSRWPRTSDAFLGLLIVVGTLSAFVTAEPDSGVSVEPVASIPWFGYLLVAAIAASMLGRRTWPVAVVAFNLAAVLVWELLGYEGDPSLGFLIGVYSVGRYVADVRWSYSVAGMTVVISVVSALLDDLPAAEGALLVASAWVPWYIGRRVRARRAYLRMLEERAEHLEREQEAEAQRAVAEERAAIARELHDVVAHRVSMMTVQAGAAKTIGEDSPEAAVEAVAAIEEEGRLALAELRDLLGVLRPDSGDSGISPQGSIAEIPDLVARLRTAGYKTQLEFDAARFAEVPSRVGMSIYRITQEALTNVVKHAGAAARVTVDLQRVPDGLTLTVADDGVALPNSDSGYGIAGMKERVSLLGGSLVAGPRPGGGWQVRAVIPLLEKTA